MKNILIINSKREHIFYLKYLTEGICDYEINARESLVETLENEKELIQNSSVVIVEFGIKGFNQYLQLIASSKKGLQTIFTYIDSQQEELNDYQMSSANLQKYNLDSGNVSQFEKYLAMLIKFDQRLTKTENYCRVKIDYFLKSSYLVCDAFIQISDDKYLKIINRHEDYSEQDITKYKDKGISYLFIKENDYKLFIQRMIKSIQQKKQSNLPIRQNEEQVIPLSCIETVHEMINKLGISQQALVLTNESINQTLGLIKKSNLMKLLKGTIGKASYIAEISLLTNYIACAACKETEWASSDNYLRLSVASFFQNISLENDEHARVQNTHNEHFLNLSQKNKKIIIDHPLKSSELILGIKGLPLGVDKIIKNHHEKYDGSGFPRGIDYTRHEPLTAIFNLSLEIADIVYEVGISRDLILDTLSSFEEKYQKGAYGKIVMALKKVFSVPLLEYGEMDY